MKTHTRSRIHTLPHALLVGRFKGASRRLPVHSVSFTGPGTIIEADQSARFIRPIERVMHVPGKVGQGPAASYSKPHESCKIL